ncbi:acid resistance repetitive basic protein Asr [Brenneria rubrifaciens]|uniref:Acid resistance repetitive basic protein Asr n=1 Tax=Brenneria rubrifaciens TaxID=55213 RepID=A0A4P8QPZ8_9GAMM|nr:acid resistance repetitive basic protein Asr [Brenneria rubrifaciens]QCR08506.1 acid resistance repetitive basic protein Asr [Brenneria rubrifaciens]
MKKVLVAITGAALGLSSVAFAADTTTHASAQVTAPATTTTPARVTHTQKHMKKTPPTEQKAQAAKKHVKKAKTAKPDTTPPAA